MKKNRIIKKNKFSEIIPEPKHINYIFIGLLFIIFVLSLYLRAVMPFDSVFRDGIVVFASDDAVFHMRLVEHTLYNFPNRIFFDAMTQYPLGNDLHFGPLWTYMIASVSLIIGLGNYNMETVNITGAYFPAVFGALVVFPVYFIGKYLGNRTTGLFAALMIAILPGQFFSRSMLGFTDHHVAEVLFSTMTLAFLMLSLKCGRNKYGNLSKIHITDKPVLLSICAGVMLAAYQLSWPGAPFFSMIIAMFIFVQSIIDHLHNKSSNYIIVSIIPMFLINMVAVLPYVDMSKGFAITVYSWFHVIVPLAGIGLAVLLNFISKETKKKGYNYFVTLFGAAVILLLTIRTLLSGFYKVIFVSIGGMFHVNTGGMSTVAEASKMFDRVGAFWGNFPITWFIQNDSLVLLLMIAIMGIVAYKIVKTYQSEYTLFLIWTIVILIATYEQNRWAYYFAVNCALLVGVAGGILITSILSRVVWNWSNEFKISNIISILFSIGIIVFFAYPSAVAVMFSDNPMSRHSGVEPSGGGFAQWYESLTWMRNNTPDPGVDFYEVYEYENNMYSYPDTAYGVMSWWDYGHIITYYAHRIPNANPFQSGIGGRATHAPGASTFLTAKTEEDATKVLYDLGINGMSGSRYIISNSYMAYQIMDVFGIWNEDEPYRTQIKTNQGIQIVPTLRYYENMEARLHIFDGNGLKQYRLVHESARNPYNDELYYKSIYNILYGGKISIENSGMVKIFEFVKGANITGYVNPTTTVSITNNIKTNIGRDILYEQITMSDKNGMFTFTVPYSTTGPMQTETNFDTAPERAYLIVSGDKSVSFNVDENDILNGNTIFIGG